MTSPYRVVLGAAFDDLHPALRAYFDGIPEGSVGRGRGVFDTVGTPRRLLWPLLAAVAPGHIAFPVWERDVPFTVENRPVAVDGAPAVRAVRRFALRGRDREMRDEIGVEGGALVDRLGDPVLLEARFAARVLDGGLRLRSTGVTLLAGRVRLRLPRAIAPVVALTERWDDDGDCQRVSITVVMPLVGRVYQYAGRFRYEVSAGEAAGE